MRELHGQLVVSRSTEIDLRCQNHEQCCATHPVFLRAGVSLVGRLADKWCDGCRLGGGDGASFTSASCLG